MSTWGAAPAAALVRERKTRMIDLHSHTLLSDGVLLPAELVRRCEAAGYRALAVTDHVGPSNIVSVLSMLTKAVADLQPHYRLLLLAGVEITHCPPEMIGALVAQAREMGAGLVLVHGETLSEPVKPGTNRAGIVAGADVLAHPGLITTEDAELAAGRGVCLEITARNGHNAANGHVAAVAREVGAQLVFGTDTHTPDDICPMERALELTRGAGLGEREAEGVFKAAWRFFE